MAESQRIYTAALIVIGDEILSGRTHDKNIAQVATWLGVQGIRMSEVRVIADDMAAIGEAVNTLRARNDYLFTTGGIGPTHDDITADSVAKAFGVGISEHPRAIELLLTRIKPEDLNEARRRMARIPHGAELVENRVSTAPGFMIGNVVVMAGVPSIMQAMLDNVTPRLKTGVKMLMETVQADSVPEGAYAAGLGAIAEKYPDCSIGSYPSFTTGKFMNQIVVRSKNADSLAAALAEVRVLIDTLISARARA